MGVKRKASFTTTASPGTSCSSETIVKIDETPKHLHSRTRKRFRDDRPDDETVYEKTICLLLSAQKKSVSYSLSSSDESTTLSSHPSLPEPMDPRQQTLRKYFQPSRRVSHTSIQMKCMPLTPETSSTFKVDNIHCCAIEVDLGRSPIQSDSGSSLSGGMEMDADMNMELDLKEQGSTPIPKRWGRRYWVDMTVSFYMPEIFSIWLSLAIKRQVFGAALRRLYMMPVTNTKYPYHNAFLFKRSQACESGAGASVLFSVFFKTIPPIGVWSILRFLFSVLLALQF
jgi:hypothetical protein